MPPSPWLLASLALPMLLPSLGTSIANVALPTLSQEFAASFQDVQWVVLSFLLATTSLVVSAGRLGDVVGRRRALLAGVVLFTAASAVCAMAPVLWLLIAVRALQGVGAAAMLALTMAFVAQAVPKERTGSVMGLLGTVSAVGTALGPSLGGWLIAACGWQAIFLVNIPLGALAFVLALRCLPADDIDSKRRPAFDNLGAITLALTLAAYALSMTLGRGSFGALNLALLIAAAVGLLAFVHVEKHAASPLVQLALFRDRRLSANLVMSVLVSAVLMASLVVGPFYLAQGLQLGTAVVGLAMSVGPAAAAAAGAPAGRLVDRFGSSVMTIAGLSGMLLGCAALAFFPVSSGLAGYVLPVIMLTGSYAVFQAANNTGTLANVPQQGRGVISGLLTLSRNLGLITGASALGAVFAAAASGGSHDTPEAVGHGLHLTFMVAGALIALSLAAAAWSQAQRSRPRNKHGDSVLQCCQAR